MIVLQREQAKVDAANEACRIELEERRLEYDERRQKQKPDEKKALYDMLSQSGEMFNSKLERSR